jgi:hypothetical protein
MGQIACDNDQFSAVELLPKSGENRLERGARANAFQFRAWVGQKMTIAELNDARAFAC